MTTTATAQALSCVVTKSALAEMLDRVVPFAARGRGAHVSLSTIRLQVGNNGIGDCVLEGAATDTEKGCRASAFLSAPLGAVPGVLCVQAQQLRDLVTRLPKGDVTLTARGHSLVVSWGKRGADRAIVPGVDPDEYGASLPEQPETPPDLLLPAQVVRDVYALVDMARAKDTTRPVLAGVGLRLSPDAITFGASDGARASLYQVSRAVLADGLPGDIIEVILPGDFLGTAAGLLPDGDEWTLGVWLQGNRRAFIRVATLAANSEAPDVLCWFQLLAGTYPDLERVMPRGEAGALFWNRDVLDGALSRVLLFSDPESSHYVQVAPAEDGPIELRTTRPEWGEATEYTEPLVEGTLPESWTFNGEMLREVCAAAGGKVGLSGEDTLRMGVTKATSFFSVEFPALAQRCRFVHVIAPVHVPALRGRGQ